jgi:molybdopterin-containing oxidoreductase family iron-sulfur binding subunit
MGKVREGRVLKLEGNPESAISAGKICGLGQAAVQAHYNPDRLRTPMMRSEGGLIPVSWDKATQMLEQRLGPTSTLKGDQIAFLTGDISGHQRVLLENFLESYDSTHHVLYDAISRVTGQAASKAVLGAEQPLLNIDKARLILSFGNDFLGAGVSPVHMAAQYAKFRKAPRGTLIQIEPRMTLTGGNADRWYPIKPGTEGILALGIAHDLLQHEEFAKGVPDEVHALVKQYDQASVSEITGIGADAVHLIAGQLWNNSPSLVIAGPGAEGHAYGFSNVVAIQLLNVILANRGKTIEGQAEHPFPQLAPLQGGYRALAKLHEQMASGQCQALLIHGTNPVFTSPSNLPFADSMEKVPFKVAFVTHLDETAGNCDLVLPLLSAMEDFGTHVADYQPNGVELMVQQPLMEKLYPESRGFGDILLDILKKRKPDSYTAFPDYYSYIKTAVVKAKPVFKVTDSDDHFWEDALRKGVIKWEGKPTALEAKLSLLEVPKPRGLEADYPFYFVPSVRPDMRDGRHAYLPWLQESPETMTTIVWDSWVEIHPKTAAEMQIREGDVLVVQSATGSVRAVAYIFPGIQPDTVSMPLGQGHTQLGRFATGVGVNPYKILDPVFDAHTGELALHATRVTLRKTGENQNVVKDEGPTNFQNGHKLVATLDADQAKLSKEI